MSKKHEDLLFDVLRLSGTEDISADLEKIKGNAQDVHAIPDEKIRTIFYDLEHSPEEKTNPLNYA